jgi:hypothetical protein
MVRLELLYAARNAITGQEVRWPAPRGSLT